MKNSLKVTVLAVIAAISFSANAALYNRGNGMIYDSSLNITWLQDANYAKTSGYDADGKMTWVQAKDWASNLVYGGFDDWRLSSAGLDGSNSVCMDEYYSACPGFYNGTYDVSYNNTRSEMGHLFAELNNKARYSTTGVEVPFENSGWLNSDFNDANSNQIISFLNLAMRAHYWETETYPIYPNTFALYFNTSSGVQGPWFQNDIQSQYYAWAVRDGDVLPPTSAVPVPAAAWLMGSGLIGLASLSRRKK